MHMTSELADAVRRLEAHPDFQLIVRELKKRHASALSRLRECGQEEITDCRATERELHRVATLPEQAREYFSRKR